jgi:hypothetical protein
MPETKTYAGGCHCGRVRYEVATELATVMECNCSHCSKRGMLLTFVTPDKLQPGGGDGLKDYQFNKKMIHHLLCPTAGSSRLPAVGRPTARRWLRSTSAASRAWTSNRCRSRPSTAAICEVG